MTFQNPYFFWFLVLLLIPILVHLFDFRRVRTIVFSNVVFLTSLKKQNVPKRRLAESLILIFRLLFVGFIVIAFTIPVWEGNSDVFGDSKCYVLDNSYSILGTCEYDDCLTRSTGVLEELIIDDERGELQYAGVFHKRRFYGKREFKSQVDDISVSKEELPSLDNRGTCVLISDFSKEFLGKVNVNDSSQFILLPLSTSSKTNLVVDSVSLVSGKMESSGKRTIEVLLKNHGADQADNVLIRLLGEDKQIASTALSIVPEGSSIIHFEIEDSGLLNFKLSVSDRATPFDNDFYFTLPELVKYKINHVSKVRNRALESVFGNDNIFDFATYNDESLDFEEILKSDVLILDSFDSPPSWLDMKTFEGKLLIFPSENIDLESYSETLSTYVFSSNDTIRSRINSSSLNHPFFSGIFDKLLESVDLPIVKTQYQLRGGDVLLEANQPFLTYLEEQGVYWFSSSISERNSDLPNHSLFLPLLYRIAESSKGFNRPLAFELTTDPISLPIQTESEAVPTLMNENGSFMPELNYRSSELVFTLPYDLNEPGIYFLVDEKDTLGRVALNYPRSETIMDYATYDELVDRFSDKQNVKVLDSRSQASMEASMNELEHGTQLWKYALILALMFLLAETAIHRLK